MLQPDPRRMRDLVRGVEGNTSEKIRRLVKAGYRQADVARFLEIRDQFVSNVVRKLKSRADTAPATAPQASTGEGWPDMGPPPRARLRLDSAGRLLVPVEFRRAMQIAEGDELMARVVDGELRLITPAMAVKRAQKLVRELIPGDESLADSLIADRRREAAKESTDG